VVQCVFCNCADTMYVSLQINLSYCSVTDIGLLSLSCISGLQNMTIVHVAGITPNGLAATLMVCGGLTKVKLHEAFRSMMLPHMIKNVEARGCVFQWIDKPFKVFYGSPGCLTHSIRPLCSPTRSCLICYSKTLHTICFRKAWFYSAVFCAARSKCNAVFFSVLSVYCL
jgi:hypothetical protein